MQLEAHPPEEIASEIRLTDFHPVPNLGILSSILPSYYTWYNLINALYKIWEEKYLAGSLSVGFPTSTPEAKGPIVID